MCLGASGSVRASSRPQRALCARLVHTFWPLTIQSPLPDPSGTAEVARPARSEPAPGSENSWHQMSSVVASGRRKNRLISSLWACSRTVGAAIP